MGNDANLAGSGRLLSFDKQRAQRRYRAGVAHEERGEESAALAAFEEAVALDGENATARIALAYHYRRTDRLAEATDQARRAVMIQPTPDTWYALGHMLTLEGAFEEALEALREALALDSHYGRAYHQIAFVYYLQGEYEIGITAFHRARQRRPEWQTLFFLAECYRLTRRIPDAKRHFQEALVVAEQWAQSEITRGQLAACERMSEFDLDGDWGRKGQVYCDSGVIYLGSAKDDGIQIPAYPFYHFTYDDVARTLQRLVALHDHCGWQWQAVVSADTRSDPLALALSTLLNIGISPVGSHDLLHVQALGDMVGPLQRNVERWGGHSFCLLSCWAEEWMADITGLCTPLVGSLPWYVENTLSPLQSSQTEQNDSPIPRLAWQDPRPAGTIANDILRTYHALAEEPSRQAQLDYYDRHPRFRWAE